eukprot:1182238-Prorocentrum_minimum.AAC.4
MDPERQEKHPGIPIPIGGNLAFAHGRRAPVRHATPWAPSSDRPTRLSHVSVFVLVCSRRARRTAPRTTTTRGSPPSRT